MKTVIGITGTTSVGKSAVAVELALMTGSEVVSADSMQIYRGMDIGTAKITAKQMRGVRHHMIDVAYPNENFSAFLYQQQASNIIDVMDSTPIVVGGTGFYFDSLLYPPEFGIASESRREELNKLYDEQGLDSLKQILKRIDAETYAKIDLNNPKRVIRAIEIAESGGALANGRARSNTPKYDLKLFVLERSRESLYEQIDGRVDAMIELGLVDEVRKLVDEYGVVNMPAFQAIGYKEIIEFLSGSLSFDDAVAKIKLNTRHYAKRQITYFKRMNVCEYINVENLTPNDIATRILSVMDKNFANLNLFCNITA